MEFKKKLATVAVASAASVALAVGVPALASVHSGAGKAVTGPEVISGTVHGKRALVKVTRFPLRWRGLVTTRSAINLGGGGPHKGDVKAFRSRAGTLTVKVTSKPTSSQSFSTRTCRFRFAEDIPVKALGRGSTGAFAGASGPGAVQVSFGETAPRYKSGPKMGQCNPKGKPIGKTAVGGFLASMVLTIG